MDAVSRLLVLVAQRRGSVKIDFTFERDVALSYDGPGFEPGQIVACEVDLETAAAALVADLTEPLKG